MLFYEILDSEGLKAAKITLKVIRD